MRKTVCMLAYKQGLTNSANTLLRVIISSMIFELFVIFDIFGIKEDSLDSFSRPVAFVKAAKPITCYSWSKRKSVLSVLSV